ncbi:AbrB family transcriptional regulator [Falsiroseomonas oryzae]|uniref:AbrB family transcriptional regulator n=1 Tax=Falsiroseomonas oryzae TaxID=2766473 RepID=UPI0022EB62B0|nr:AbrB family transcriptional regulator [Roseomonas sp. MO-31]
MPVLPTLARLRPVALTAVAAVLGGGVFWLLHIPLAWMLGAMAATAAMAWHERAEVLRPTRPAAMIVLGLGLGQTFTAPVMAAVGLALPWLVLAAVLSILVGALAARVFARLAGTDLQTGYYASVPGGVVVMAVLAQRAGLPVAPVTLAQTIRVMIVVVVVPPLVTWLASRGDAGAFLAERPEVHAGGLAVLVAGGVLAALALSRTGIANPWMFGPCALVIVLSYAGVLPSGVPGWMVDAAQVGMGMSLGQRVSKGFILSSRRLALASALTTLLLIAVMAMMALGLAWVSGLPAAAVVLGMAPGGMPEMSITAKALEVGVPLVLGFHLVRTLFCNLFVTAAWRLAVRVGLAR